jgi:serine/threonine protein kinase
MPFRVQSATYDEASLEFVGAGQYGEVWDLGGAYAAKLYYSRPDQTQTRKLTQLFDIGRALTTGHNATKNAAMPLRPALDVADGGTVGFSMAYFRGWLSLSPLCFDLRSTGFPEDRGFRFTDATAVAASYSLFQTLYALSRQKLTIGDISAGNILVNPADGTPAFIDLDSAHFQDWDSESLGTPGYVDPRLFDAGLNSKGGYHFDAQSDVFALTAVCFVLFTGLMPFMFGVTPPMKDTEFLQHRLSSLRVLLRGETCLQAVGRQLANRGVLGHLDRRLRALRDVKGESGEDGERLYRHFVHVLVEGGRENLIEDLPDTDSRNPNSELLTILRTREVRQELWDKFGRMGSASAPATLTRDKVPIPRRSASPQPWRDPSEFGDFLVARAIDLDAMVAG